MKRNTMFGGLALLAAGAAIGAGAMVSSNAIADTGEPAPTDQLTMVSAGPDGDAFQCSFEGADVEGLLPDLPAGSAAGVAVVGNVVVGSGEILPADGSLPELVLSGSSGLPEGAPVPEGGITVLATAVPLGAEGQPTLPMPAGAPVQMLSVDDAREGTAEECNTLHDQAVEMAAQVAAGGAQLVTSGTAVAVEP
jgi:hypothetical protein